MWCCSAVSAGRELTALDWSTTQGDLNAPSTVIKTGISNAVLDSLASRGSGMLGLAQQWWESSWRCLRLLQKGWSRGAVLRMLPMCRHCLNVQCIHQSCWVFLVSECKISFSTWKIHEEVLSLSELFRRDCCPNERAGFFLVLIFAYSVTISFLVLAQREVGR